MTPTETTTILRQFNEWRRGDYEPSEQPAPPDPCEIGLAIDAAIEMIERLDRFIHQEPVAYLYEYVSPMDGKTPVWRAGHGEWNGQQAKSAKPLYALPEAKGEEK